MKLDIPEQFFVDTGLKVYNIQPLDVKIGKVVKYFPVLVTLKFTYDKNYTLDGGVTALANTMFYLVEKSNSSNRNVSIYNAQDFTEPIDPPPTGYRRENITDWHLDEDYLPVGYLYNGSFYLYALDKVIIFEDKMPSYERQIDTKDHPPLGSLISSSKVTIIKLKDFFQCESANLPNVTHPPDGRKTVSTSTDSGTMLILIIAVVAILLILIGAAILLYCCLNKKNGKEKKSKSKKVASKVEKPSLASSSVDGSKVSSKIGRGGSKMTSKQSTIAADGKSKAASSTCRRHN